MMRFVPRDEREAGVDLAADRLALIVVSYGLLLVVAYRAFVLREEAWDLMALLIVSGVWASATASARAWPMGGWR